MTNTRTQQPKTTTRAKQPTRDRQLRTIVEYAIEHGETIQQCLETVNRIYQPSVSIRKDFRDRTIQFYCESRNPNKATKVSEPKQVQTEFKRSVWTFEVFAEPEEGKAA